MMLLLCVILFLSVSMQCVIDLMNYYLSVYPSIMDNTVEVFVTQHSLQYLQ